MQSYISSVVGIDTQGIVQGRPQHRELIESHTSMLLRRNLVVPQPPESQLTHVLAHIIPFETATGTAAETTAETATETLADPTHNITLPDLTPAQQYEICRQSRKKMYDKEQEKFFSGTQGSSKGSNQSACLSRLPSRYLHALLKHERDRRRVIALMYPDVFEEVKDAGDDATRTPFALDTDTDPSESPRIELTPISDIIEPLVRIANPRRGRYAYQSAEPTANNCCRICKSKLDMTCPERVNNHLLQCAQQKQIRDGRAHMNRQFACHLICLWDECHYRIRTH
jgi:hypothetical protein